MSENEKVLKILLKEYQICCKDAARLESNIWQTAALFSICSGIGLISFVIRIAEINTIKGTPNKLLMIVPLFAISVSIAWWRFARRWWSIQQLKYKRMRDIETEVRYMQTEKMIYDKDKEAMSHVKNLTKESGLLILLYQVLYDIESIKSNDSAIMIYEYRGI